MHGRNIILFLFYLFVLTNANGQVHSIQPELGVNTYIDRGYNFKHNETGMEFRGKPSSTFQVGFNYRYTFHPVFKFNVGTYLSFVSHRYFFKFYVLNQNSELEPFPEKSGWHPGDGTCFKFPLGISAEIPIVKDKHFINIGFYFINQLYVFKHSESIVISKFNDGSNAIQLYEYIREKNQKYQALANLRLEYSYRVGMENRIHFYFVFEPEITLNKYEQRLTLLPGSSLERKYSLPYQSNHNLQFGMGYTFIK